MHRPLLTRPVGCLPKRPQVFFASFTYQAQSWSKPHRVVAKVEWHQGELYPRVGFILIGRGRVAWPRPIACIMILKKSLFNECEKSSDVFFYRIAINFARDRIILYSHTCRVENGHFFIIFSS